MKSQQNVSFLYAKKTFTKKILLNILFIFSLALILGSIIAAISLSSSLNITYINNLTDIYGTQCAIIFNVDKMDINDDSIEK